VRSVVGPEVEIVAVVKANAYGHGAVEVSRTLVAEGARWLAVSFVEEGIALRQAGIGARILVMADRPACAHAALVEHQLTRSCTRSRTCASSIDRSRAAPRGCPTTQDRYRHGAPGYPQPGG